jgi:hypothetical protein
MNNDRHELFEGLQRQVLAMRQVCEQMEGKIEAINQGLRVLEETGLTNEIVILGKIVHRSAYAPRAGGNDSGQLYQAALLVPKGIGVVIWDTEEFVQLENVPQALEAEAPLHFLAFAECKLAWKLALVAEVELLLQRLAVYLN